MGQDAWQLELKSLDNLQINPTWSVDWTFWKIALFIYAEMLIDTTDVIEVTKINLFKDYDIYWSICK